MFERGRVVEVRAPRRHEGEENLFGSGYRIADGLVLTARHVVTNGDAVQVKALGTGTWKDARVLWRGRNACDAALLALGGVEGEMRGQGLVRFGWLAGDARVPGRSLGFPLAQEEKLEGGGVRRDTEDIEASISGLAALKAERLTVHIQGSVPEPERSGEPSWAGISGAALFSDNLLVGVLIVQRQDFGASRLEAVPASTLVAAPGFRAALGEREDRPFVLEAVEAQGVLRRSYRPLPEDAAPSLLLQAPFEAVQFRGRAGELDELGSWCGTNARLAVRVIQGVGGAGKTRLAAQLARMLGADGWVSGFLEDDTTTSVVLPVVQLDAPILAVIDYAESRPDAVVAFLDAAIEARQRVRIVLLAREVGDWWHGLPSRVRRPEARAALKHACTMTLKPLEETAVGRAEAFSEAASSFGASTAEIASASGALRLDQPPFDRVLFLHMAALAVGTGRAPSTVSQGLDEDLLRSTLDREARFWAQSAKAQGLGDLDARRLERAVALATLAKARDETEAATALCAVPDFEEETEGRRQQIARWLHDLYPGTSWLRPLEPDLLGEGLVAQVIADVPTLASRVLATAPGDSAVRLITVLARAGRSRDHIRHVLRRLLADHLEQLTPTAIEVAERVGKPLPALLAAVIVDTDADAAFGLVDVVPQDTVALREFARVVTVRALQHVRTSFESPSREFESARLLDRLSVRLAKLGRRDDALAAGEEAVGLYRTLTEINPDAFRPKLAMSLSNLSGRFGELGRHQDALAAVQEALDHYRRLPDADAERFRPNLAISLSNLARRLTEVGRPEDALPAAKEAVVLNRELADRRPDAFRPTLAASLNNLFFALEKLNLPDEALAAIDEATAIYRDLSNAQPDAFRPDLARSLNNLSNQLAQVDRSGDALPLIEEAVAIRRVLARDVPAAFQEDLATSLNNLSNRLAELGRAEEALRFIEEAAELCRELVAVRRETFRPLLARALCDLSLRLAKLRRRDNALAAIEEAVVLRREDAAVQPHVFRLKLAYALRILSQRLDDLGRSREAEEAAAEAAELDR